MTIFDPQKKANFDPFSPDPVLKPNGNLEIHFCPKSEYKNQKPRIRWLRFFLHSESLEFRNDLPPKKNKKILKKKRDTFCPMW